MFGLLRISSTGVYFSALRGISSVFTRFEIVVRACIAYVRTCMHKTFFILIFLSMQRASL